MLVVFPTFLTSLQWYWEIQLPQPPVLLCHQQPRRVASLDCLQYLSTICARAFTWTLGQPFQAASLGSCSKSLRNFPKRASCSAISFSRNALSRVALRWHRQHTYIRLRSSCMLSMVYHLR